MITPLNTLKSWFRTGLKPPQEQFWAWMDSYFHKDEKIPAASIEGLDALLGGSDAKIEAEAALLRSQMADALAAHDADPVAHPPLQARIDDVGTASEFIESFNLANPPQP